MSYIEVLIPFLVGCFLASSPQSIVQVTAPSYEKKRKTLRKSGYTLIGVSALYFVIKICSS